MRYTNDKDLNKLIKGLRKQGWIFQKRKKHGMLIPPDEDGQKICVSITPRAHRSCVNVSTLINRKTE